MLSSLAVALMFLSAAEPLTITVSRLFGAPTSIERSLEVTCAERNYSFKFGVSRGEASVEFDREPLAPTEKLSAEVIDAFKQFYDVPFIEAWCAGPSADKPAGILNLEITGLLKINYDDAYKKCVKRGGMFDPKSWRLVTIDDDTAYVDGDDIGKCITKDDIDEISRLNRGSNK